MNVSRISELQIRSYLLTPLTKLDIVTGLVISGLSITMLIAIVILSVSMIITGISFSRTLIHLASLLVILLLTTTSLSSLMFVLLGRLRHPRVVGIVSGFMNVILFFPSGAVYPIASLPHWLKAFAKINPKAYAVHALKSVLFKGVVLRDIITDLAPAKTPDKENSDAAVKKSAVEQPPG